MEKNQSELCFEVLRRFHKAGILENIILIGSWCTYFYQYCFKQIKPIPLKTRDIDFLVEYPKKIRNKIDIPDLLKDLGFVTSFKGKAGYIKLYHPDLIIEFLVPERGRGTDKPSPLPQFGINATSLRFLNLLTDNTVAVRLDDNFCVTVPHPINFGLHKLIISQRRKMEDKSAKDLNMAHNILSDLIKNGEAEKIIEVYSAVPKKWQKKIINVLENSGEKEILKIFK